MSPPDKFLCKVENAIQPTKRATFVIDVSYPYVCLDQHMAKVDDMYRVGSIAIESNFILINFVTCFGLSLVPKPNTINCVRMAGMFYCMCCLEGVI